MKLTLICTLFVCLNASAITPDQAERLADAIWIAEGGAKTKYPYGIRSINTHGDATKARRICLNTIRNNYVRWVNAGRPGEYVVFLANRYCPVASDPRGNANWIRNVKFYFKDTIK